MELMEIRKSMPTKHNGRGSWSIELMEDSEAVKFFAPFFMGNPQQQPLWTRFVEDEISSTVHKWVPGANKCLRVGGVQCLARSTLTLDRHSIIEQPLPSFSSRSITEQPFHYSIGTLSFNGQSIIEPLRYSFYQSQWVMTLPYSGGLRNSIFR